MVSSCIFSKINLKILFFRKMITMCKMLNVTAVGAERVAIPSESSLDTFESSVESLFGESLRLILVTKSGMFCQSDLKLVSYKSLSSFWRLQFKKAFSFACKRKFEIIYGFLILMFYPHYNGPLKNWN